MKTRKQLLKNIQKNAFAKDIAESLAKDPELQAIDDPDLFLKTLIQKLTNSLTIEDLLSEEAKKAMRD